MEQLDLEQPRAAGRFGGFKSNWSNDEAGGRCANRLIVLRKYSPLICLLELITIALFVYLLLFRASNNQDRIATHLDCPQASGEQLPRIITWNNGSSDAGGTRYLLLDLVSSCNQRRYDQQMSVRCASRQLSACRPIETRAPDEPAGEGSGDKLASIIVTSKRGERLERRTTLLRSVSCGIGCEFKTKLLVIRDAARQKIIGWGGALTDSSINNLLSLSTNGTRQLLDDYFGAEGLMFNMIRITIGGSDFSSRFYTNDDSTSDDFNLSNFKLREEDLLYKIAALKLIQQEFNQDKRLLERNGGEIKLFASMWSPPVWMKTNGHFNKGQLRGHIDDEPVLNGKRRRDELFYNSLAELKTRFIQAYQNEGIRFWGLTVMNEPVFAVQPFLDFNTMIFPADDYANYVAKYLGPKIKGNPLLKHIKLIAHDDNRRFLANFSWPILDQKRVRQYLDGVSVHGYADEAYHLMSETFARYRDDKDDERDRAKPGDAHFFVLPTELCSGHLPFMAKALVGNWHRGVHYALDIIRSLQNAASGWVDWNMALDLEGGPGWLGGRLDAPVIVDKARDLYHKSPMFFVLGQFSRYIPPGSRRIDSYIENAQFDHQFEVVSFLLTQQRTNNNKNEPEKLATVILNNNPYAIDVHLQIGSRQTTGKLGQKFYVIPCPADSIQTVIYTSD